MKDEKTDIAKELSRICKEKGISRYSLSKRTGIPDSTLQNYGPRPIFLLWRSFAKRWEQRLQVFSRVTAFPILQRIRKN